VLNALSSFFGGVKSAESRALLWEIAKTPKARVSAANALCRIGDPRDLPRLAQLLQIKDWMLSNLPGALNRAYGEKARPYLQKAAKSAPDPAVRRGAARTLAEMDKAKSRANTAPPPTGR
jgi:HEAT repeat protein